MKTVTVNEVNEKLLLGESLNILDVREVAEVQKEKIPSAVNIPLRLLEFRMNELDKKKQYYVICQSGGRSSQAVQFLEYQGYNVININGGMLDWNGSIE
ncbi:rhodanese-like domain-containing protein [Rossellomorea aquimaris]|uniref:rhodanese-like domain-containing protein n=1 Tax=Rossellomorea aquimaris TaxID=189382 RepID=UPI0007D055F3|nr:rhodanese-like domain-containing protein [Rossellomorea aquimaris]